tara:strand:+ start:44 stop:544 length:501 start_codon:yes stop_codon:yes gene_type:complete
MRTALYRQFTDDKTLLYVGISLNAQNRLSQHYKSSAWFTEVTDVTIEWFDTREEALKAEVTAIHNEKPKCNIHHNSQAHREIEEASQEEFQGMNRQVMRLLEGSGKVFFSKSEVGNFLGISNFYITNFIEQKKLKVLQPFLPDSRREVFYINDIINLIAEMTEDKL